MVVVRTTVTALFLAAASGAFAQEAHVRAWVDRTDQRVDRPFWLHIEAAGERIESPRIPQVENLIIAGSPAQQSRSFVFVNGQRHETLKLSYPATATAPGEIEIPSITIVVSGNEMHTDLIRLMVSGGSAPVPPAVGDPTTVWAGGSGSATGVPARLWIDDDTVIVGIPFWLHMEGTGRKVELPARFVVDGLSIDFKNARRRNISSSVFTRTVRHDMYCTARRPGTIRIPPQRVVIDGKVYLTKEISLDVIERPAPAKPISTKTEDRRELYKEDLVFIRMETDKTEVYQGEPILLTKQLWRIIYGQINSGPHRGGLIISPTTEGFYVTYLDPATYEKMEGPWKYEVSEERMVLYPTAIGALKVGQWHWEGVALVNRQNILARNKLYYKLNAGPVHIQVKPLPARPRGFSGAVGKFTVQASLSDDTVTQGVPAELVVTVTGQGNPDAIGEPAMPEMPWAHLDRPDRVTEIYRAADTLIPTVERSFKYTLTPLEGGDVVIGGIQYVFFDPEAQAYRTETVSPFNVSVRATSNAREHLVLAADISIDERTVDILGEDIRPLVVGTGPLSADGTSLAALPAMGLVPVLAYCLLFAYAARKRRFKNDTAFARAYHAKSKSLKRLQTLDESPGSADELYRAIITFVGDTFDVHDAGMTSGDVEALASKHGIPLEIRDNVVKILKACERVGYASEAFSADEMRALVRGAEASVIQLGDAAREAKR